MTIEEKIIKCKEEISKANPNGLHIKDLKRHLKKLQKERLKNAIRKTDR